MYRRKYFRQLMKLDPYKVLKDLGGKILCCTEDSEIFCHRHLISEWIYVETKYFITEIYID